MMIMKIQKIIRMKIHKMIRMKMYTKNYNNENSNNNKCPHTKEEPIVVFAILAFTPECNKRLHKKKKENG